MWTIDDFPNHTPDEVPYIEHCIGLERALVGLGVVNGVTVIDEQRASECSWRPSDDLHAWRDDDEVEVQIRDLRPRKRADALQVVLECMTYNPRHESPWTIYLERATGDLKQHLQVGSNKGHPVRPRDFVWRGEPIVTLEAVPRARLEPDSSETRDEQIVRMRAEGVKVAKIAGVVGCSVSTVYNALKRHEQTSPSQQAST